MVCDGCTGGGLVTNCNRCISPYFLWRNECGFCPEGTFGNVMANGVKNNHLKYLI
jgi:hypothetical protein